MVNGAPVPLQDQHTVATNEIQYKRTIEEDLVYHQNAWVRDKHIGRRNPFAVCSIAVVIGGRQVVQPMGVRRNTLTLLI